MMLALLAMLTVISSAPGLCNWPQQHGWWAGHTAGLSSVCWLHTELLLLTRVCVCVCVCVSAWAALRLPHGSCLPHFFFFFFFHRICLWLIMNKNDDMIFLYSIWKSTKAGWGKRGIEGEKGEECNKLKQNKLRLTCLWHTLWIQTLRLWWYSGMPSIWLSTGCFQGYFCWELSHGAVKIVKKKIDTWIHTLVTHLEWPAW